MESHLLQMRGLKPLYPGALVFDGVSHLLQMRGLKQVLNKYWLHHLPVASFTDAWIETKPVLSTSNIKGVASFTDAWIETFNPMAYLKKCQSRIFYRCVD